MTDLCGIDMTVWEVVATYAEWVKVPTADAAVVAGTFLRRRLAADTEEQG